MILALKTVRWINRFSVLCERVLIPLGSLLAIFLIMLAVMLITT
jgi:hypothetical protein